MHLSSALPHPDTRPEFYRGVMPKRALAWCVDMAIATIIAAMIVPFTFFLAIFFFPVLVVTVNFVYRWVSIALSGATLGMHLMALEMRGPDNGAPDQQTALLHALGTTFVLTVVPLHLISIAMIMVSDHGQSLMDKLLGTVIMNRGFQPH